ncbi:MAG: adenylate cyclase, partial [Proteobacteria bacterium]|nr:adenylate cyclase [Pseudomonadota bacterium]
MRTVKQWLDELGLPQYAELFADNDVDFEALCLLTDAELEKVGVSLGHRKKLLKALGELGERRAPAPGTELVGPNLGPPDASSSEAERRQLTVMFCDLVGSTELSTKLDPEQLRDLMQAYQCACREAIEHYEGHIAQYLGDGLMVYFGWPRAHEDDAVRAIRAGLEVTQAISELQTSVPMRARVGIHTGLVVVGETGRGDASSPKAAVGETPNIAARLQALAEPGSVVVSERTRGLAAGLFEYAELGTPPLKGVAEPLRAFRVIGSRATDSFFDASRSESALTPLVGREEEVALLLRRWQQAQEGEGQVVLIGGEPGIGKSRLTRVLQERLASENYIALRYQCSPFHVHSALHAVIEQLERAAGFTRDDTPEQRLDKLEAVLAGGKARVAEVAPLLAAMLSLPLDRYPPLNLSPQKQRDKTLEALAGQVEALAQRQPVLMIYEDVHWIDTTTQEVLDLLVPRLLTLPVLLILTHRPEYSAKWAGQAHATLLGLTRLGSRQGAELVTRVAGRKALPAEVLERIVAHTDGVPLFVEELTKSILESKLLREEGSRYVLEGALPTLAIPTTLRDLLIARLDRLGPARELAQIGACIGREFSYDLLAAVSPQQGAKLDAAVGKLTASGLLFRRGTPPEATYTFKHALVQDAAYDSLLKSRRVQLHAQIAQVLEKRFRESAVIAPELVARHYTEAGLATQALPYWRQAGETAYQRSANQDAITHLRQGLTLLQALPDGAERAHIEVGLHAFLGLASAAAKGYASPEAEDAYRKAHELCRQIGGAAQLFPVIYGLFMFHWTRGNLELAHQFAEQLLAAGESVGDVSLRLVGESALGNILWHMGQN